MDQATYTSQLKVMKRNRECLQIKDMSELKKTMKTPEKVDTVAHFSIQIRKQSTEVQTTLKDSHCKPHKLIYTFLKPQTYTF